MSNEDAIAASAALDALADDPGGWATFAVRGTAERGARTIDALLARAERAERERDELRVALEIAREYMHYSFGSQYEGPDPYPIIDAALARAREGARET